MATVLIQSTVSSVTAKYIRAAASADGMSVAAWVRRVLEAQRLASGGRTLEARVREFESRVAALEGAAQRLASDGRTLESRVRELESLVAILEDAAK